jgi:transposase
MNQEKYIGMDVHQATISVAVMDAGGKLIMECLLETKAATIVEFIRGLHGTLSLTFEEGTSAVWLHDLLKPHVSRLVVCDPRKSALLKDGNKNDRIDARKLAELLRGNQLHPVYHRRAWGSHLERAGAQLSDHHSRCHPRHESHQSAVPQLGDSLRWHNRLRATASRRVVGQDR